MFIPRILFRHLLCPSLLLLFLPSIFLPALALHPMPTLEHWHGLFHLGPIHHNPRLRLPSGIGLGGQVLDLLLSAHLGMLFLDGGRVLAQVAQPLVPLRRDLDVGIMRVARVLYDAPPAGGSWVIVAAHVAEFPVGISLEIEAFCGREKLVSRRAREGGRAREGVRTDEESLAPWQTESFPLIPCSQEGRDLFGGHWTCRLQAGIATVEIKQRQSLYDVPYELYFGCCRHGVG